MSRRKQRRKSYNYIPIYIDIYATIIKTKENLKNGLLLINFISKNTPSNLNSKLPPPIGKKILSHLHMAPLFSTFKQHLQTEMEKEIRAPNFSKRHPYLCSQPNSIYFQTFTTTLFSYTINNIPELYMYF